MSESESPSYYEIAMTGRQVTGSFAAILVLILGAFFAGVWVGSGRRRVPTPAEELAALGAPTPAGPELTEFSFFAEEGGSDGGTAEPAPRPRADGPSGLAGRTGAGEAEGAGTRQVSLDPVADTPRIEPLAGDEGEAEARSAPDRIAQVPAPAGAGLAPSPGPVSEAAAGDHVVQVLATDDDAQAQQVLERLRGGGLPVFVLSDEADGRRRHRVRVGPYATRAEAEAVAARLRQRYRLDTWIPR